MRQPRATRTVSLIGVCSFAMNARASTFEIYSTPAKSSCTLDNAVYAINHPGANVAGCPAGTGGDVIHLQGGQTFNVAAGLNFLTHRVTISAWSYDSKDKPLGSTLNRAILQQSGLPNNTDGAMVFVNNGGSTNMPIVFNNIDFKGTGATNSAQGISVHGNDRGDTLTFNGCWVEGFGAEGIYDQDYSLTLQDTAVDNNNEDGNVSLFGGAVSLEAENLNGGAPSPFITFTMNHSSITNNKSGGFFAELGATSVSTIKNSTIASNSGGSGILAGGIHTRWKLNIIGSTIWGNSSDRQNQPCTGSDTDAGVVNDGTNGDDADISISQTIVSNNEAACGASADFRGILTSMTNSMIDDVFSTFNLSGPWPGPPATALYPQTAFHGTNILDDVSNLAPLADNGGVAGQSRHPQSNLPHTGSPAINVSATADPALNNQDQGYRARGLHGTSQQRYDIGAVEVQ